MDEGATAMPAKRSKARFGKSLRAKLAISLFVVLVVIGSGVLLWLHFAQTDDQGLPSSVIKQISGLDPYYFKPGYATDFKLQRQTVSYKQHILVFTMKNSVGKTLAFTEERTPPHFDPSMLTTSSQSNTEYGQELITDDGDHTVGVLFSADHTWVVVNAPNPIGSDAMKQIIEALSPLRPKD